MLIFIYCIVITSIVNSNLLCHYMSKCLYQKQQKAVMINYIMMLVLFLTTACRNMLMDSDQSALSEVHVKV